MRSLFLLVLCFIFFILALKTRIAGLYTYWWFSIFRPHEWDWAGTLSNFKLPLIAALLLIIPCILQRKYPKLNHPIAILMLGWFSLVLIADYINGCDSLTFVRTSTSLSLFILLYISLLTSSLITNIKQLYWLLFIIGLSIGFHSGKGGIMALLTGANYYDKDQLSGLFSGSNAYALGSGMILFFMIFVFNHINSKFIFDNKEKWYAQPIMLTCIRIVFALMILGSFYNIIAIQSRGAFISTSIGLALFVLYHKAKIKWLFILILSVTLGLSLAPLPDGYTERIASAFAEKESRDKSVASRPHYWAVARSMVKSNPLGVGPGCYPYYYRFYDTTDGFYGIYRSVHSSHFQILADSGYLGGIVWILLLIISYRRLYKLKRKVICHIICIDKQKIYIDAIITFLCSLTVFVIGGSFYEYAYNDIIWLIFSLVIALELMVQKEIDDVKREKQPILN